MVEKKVRQRRPLGETKQILLETAYQLLVTRGFRMQVDIKLVDVVKAAGHTTGAAYRIWQSQEEFQRELAHFVVRETSHWSGVETIADELVEVLASGPTFEEMVRQAGNLYIKQFLDREEFFTLLYFHAVRERDDELSDSISDGYDRIHEEFRELFSGLLELYGREMRAPFELDDLCVAAGTLAEGMALRHRIQPDRINRYVGPKDESGSHPFSAALLALGLNYTQPTTAP